MVFVDCRQVDVGEYVGIVHQERFVAVQKRACFLYPSAGVEQRIPFVADVYGNSEIVMGADKPDYLLAEVVDVDCNVVEPGVFQP